MSTPGSVACVTSRRTGACDLFWQTQYKQNTTTEEEKTAEPEKRKDKNKRRCIGGAALKRKRRRKKKESVGAPSTSYNKACDL